MTNYVFLLLILYLYLTVQFLILATLMALIDARLFTAVTVCDTPPSTGLGETGRNSAIHRVQAEMNMLFEIVT